MQGADPVDAADKVTVAISSGAAMQKFAAMITALGGPPDMAEDWRTHLPQAPVVGDVTAPVAGHVTAIDGEALGLAVVSLGGGRKVETDRINPAVGLTQMVGLGDQINAGDPLCVLHATDEDTAIAAAEAVRKAITIGEQVAPGPLILKEVI